MKKFLTRGASLLILGLPLFLFAAGGNPCPANTVCIPNPLKSGTNTLYDFIVLIINQIIIPIGGVITVLAIIYAGFMLVTAQGDVKKLEEGKRAFMYAALGALILLGAWAIAQAIQGTINQLIN